MKILQVYKDYYPPVKGGIESHINLLSNGLKARGVDVQVLVSNTSNRFEIDTFDGISVFKAPQYGRFQSAPLTPTFARYLKRFGSSADVIHFHYPNPTAEFSYFFTSLKKKLIVTYHSDIIRQDKLGKLYSPFRSIFLTKADRIIATSPNYIQSSKVLRKYKERCTVIPLGIDVRRFTGDADRPLVEAIKTNSGGTPLILFVGCFRYYKGLHLLIAAMKSVRGRLLLIGTGPEEARLRSLVATNRLEDKITFLGELSDEAVNAYYKACDLFVLPSHLRSEAFGLVQLEAMCCAKPVISTELETGTDYVNVNQKTGFTVKANDVRSLSQAINYLIDHPEKRSQFGENGFRRVNRYFTAERMVDDTLRLYREVTRKPVRSVGRISGKVDSIAVDRKIKVLRVVSRLNIGGPSIHVKNLTDALDGDRFTSKLVTGSISPGEGDMSYITDFKSGVRVVIPELQREINVYKDFVALLKVIRLIRRFNPDIVHSHTSKAGTVSRIAAVLCNLCHKYRIIVLHTFHGNVLYGYFNKIQSYLFVVIERLLATCSDRIIAISKSQKWELSSVYKIGTPDKIDIIKLGFDLSPFLSSSTLKGVLRQRLGLPEDTIVVGIVGRMAPIKNHTMFLDSAKLLLGAMPDKDIRFLLVGDGEERSFLEQYVDQLGIAERVIFHGWEKNIPMIYAGIDILALTSLNEGTPVSVIEAMAARVPVVTTGVGGIKDLLGRIEAVQPDGQHFKICERGILCPKDDAAAFSSAMAFMLANEYRDDQDRLERAKAYVVHNYSVERLVRDVEELYERLVDQRRHIIDR